MSDSGRLRPGFAAWGQALGGRNLLVCGLLSCLVLAGCMEESPDLMVGSSNSGNPGVAGPPGPPVDGGVGGPAPGVPGAATPGPGGSSAPADGANPMAAAGTPGPAGAEGGQAAAGDTAGASGTGTAAGAPAAATAGGAGDAGAGSGSGVAAAATTGSASGVPGGAQTAAGQPAGGAGQPANGGGQPAPAPGNAASSGAASTGILDRLFSGSTGAGSSSSNTGSSASNVAPPPSGTTTVASLPRVLKDQADKPIQSQEDLKKGGRSVKLEGTLSCSVCKGSILLNVVSSTGLVTCAPGLKSGAFSILVPRSAGGVILTAIADDNGDGFPTSGEPLGSYIQNPVNIGEQDVSGISIQIGKAVPPPSSMH